jgi:putative ABC transport system substrate-binding protein
MRRSVIGLLVTFALGILWASLATEAPPPPNVHRIGVLIPTSPLWAQPLSEAFRQGLRDLGYVEGQSIALEYRYAEEKVERLPVLASELVRLKVDIILAQSIPAVRAAQHSSETIPIVFTAVDPMGQGLVASLARPGGNITGYSFHDPALMGKQLELLKAAVPSVTRVAYLWNANLTSARYLHEAERAARALSIQLHPVEVREPYAFDQAFATMAEAHVDALITPPSGPFFGRRTQLVDLALQTRLPGVFPDREFVEAGGLMSYGDSVPAVFYRLATYTYCLPL